MKATDLLWLALLLSALSCSSCATIHGSGDGQATSRPVCLTRAQWLEIKKAQIKCEAAQKSRKAAIWNAREEERLRGMRGITSCTVSLHQARMERDAAMARKCERAKCPSVAGYVAGLIVSGVAILGMGIALVVVGVGVSR